MRSNWTTSSASAELEKLIEQIDTLQTSRRRSAEHVEWLLNVATLLREVFGEGSPYFQSFGAFTWADESRLQFVPLIGAQQHIEARDQAAYREQLDAARGMLRACRSDLERRGIENVYVRAAPLSDVSWWTKYSGEGFAFALGIAVTLAVVRWSWLYLAFAVLPLIGLLQAVEIIPSWTGLRKLIVDVAVVAGAVATVVQLVVDLARHGQ